MHAIARTKYLRMSPKKVRHVANLIKGKPVLEALNILNFTPNAAAQPLAKTLKAAASNAIANEGTSKLKAEDLAIKKIYIDEAPTMRRVRYQSMGRVFLLRKRMCHITIEVEGEPEREIATRTAKPRTKKEGAEGEADTAEQPKRTRKPARKKATGAKKTSKTGAKKKAVKKSAKSTGGTKKSAKSKTKGKAEPAEEKKKKKE